jgi:hypothetical protein
LLCDRRLAGGDVQSIGDAIGRGERAHFIWEQLVDLHFDLPDAGVL